MKIKIFPCLALLISSGAAATEQLEDLSALSLKELGDVEVTSVSKSVEAVRDAPAAIFVITHDDIMRSGATSIPEALRLAPNLLITQYTSSNFVAAARGFGGAPAAQNFSNKLLILIDGRSVYTPLYSGVYLDVQDVLLDDVDRIEVISGPGATLWGANAMNGVINIITRSAYLTQGALVSAAGGNFEQNLSARYGAKLGSDAALRIYGKAFRNGAEELGDGRSAHDDWYKGQGGFRLDWSRAHDSFTAQGDLYRGLESQPDAPGVSIEGANLLARWQHRSGASELQLQTYFDQTQRAAPLNGTKFVLRTYDLELQQSIAIGANQKIVWGAGERVNSYGIVNTPSLLFQPPERSLTLGNLFAQDTFSLHPTLKLTVGAKLENDPYSGWAVQPDARVAWEPGPATLLWAAASRAIRSPTPFDADVVEKLGGTTFLTGNPDFRPERVTAYEIGYRGDPAANLSVSLSTFYNLYDDLRSIETASSTVFLPLQWGNGMRGHTYGVEFWAHWQVTERWRLSPGLRVLHEDLEFKPGASGLLGTAQAGDDPTHRALLTSTTEFGNHMTFDATLRYVGALPDPALPSFWGLSARLGWTVSRALDVAISGANLLHPRHREFPAPDGEEIDRSVRAEIRWRS